MRLPGGELLQGAGAEHAEEPNHLVEEDLVQRMPSKPLAGVVFVSFWETNVGFKNQDSRFPEKKFYNY